MVEPTTITPDVSGFVAAQARLREQGGATVVFKVPIEKTWPPETKLNPANGLPYDSTIKQTSQEFRDVPKSCLIIAKQGSPLRPQADTHSEPAGDLSGMDIILDLADADKPDVEEATQMVVNELTYRVEEMKPFSLSTTRYRWLVYGQEL